jgi:hypothetical protein
MPGTSDGRKHRNDDDISIQNTLLRSPFVLGIFAGTRPTTEGDTAMITRVNNVNGSWFAYTLQRVLGPFKTAKEAWHAVANEE